MEITRSSHNSLELSQLLTVYGREANQEDRNVLRDLLPILNCIITTVGQLEYSIGIRVEQGVLEDPFFPSPNILCSYSNLKADRVSEHEYLLLQELENLYRRFYDISFDLRFPLLLHFSFRSPQSAHDSTSRKFITM